VVFFLPEPREGVMQKDQAVKSVTPEASEEVSEVVCYRSRCAESGNGLSHYVMYGDLPQEVVNE
jgi:hypothetical protein